MQKSTLRLFSRATPASFTAPCCTRSPSSLRLLFPSRRAYSRSATAAQKSNKDDPYHESSTAAAPGTSAGKHEGASSRTDNRIRFEYPADGEMSTAKPLQGRGGGALGKRTLASFSLEGRTVVVTGGARGLGLVMGQAIIDSGADLAIVDLNKDEAENSAKDLVTQYQQDNPDSTHTPTVTAHYCDVSSPSSVDSAISSILSSHNNKIDHLVTSAGFTENFDAITYPYDRLKKLWSVNVDGTYLFASAVSRHLIARQSPGSLVLIGSMSGAIVNVPQPQTPYNISKAAVRHLAASLAVELAHANIRVNCISPGYMLTALTRKILDDKPDLTRQWTSLIPTGKMGRPEDLMGAVVYLLSDASGYVTGADLRVDGGYTCT